MNEYKRILYFHHTVMLGGAPTSLLSILGALDRSRYEPIVALPKPGPLSRVIQEMGIEVVFDRRIVPFLDTPSARNWFSARSNVAGILRTLSAIRCARDITCQVQPDIVHFNSSVLTHMTQGVRLSGFGQTIVHLREHWDLRHFDFRRRLMRKWISKGVDDIVSISPYAAALYSPGNAFVHVPNWPDFEDRSAEINLHDLASIPLECPIVLAPSSRAWIKGADIAVAAMEYVYPTNAMLVVAGGASPSTETANKVAARKVLSAVGRETYGMQLNRLASESSRSRLIPPVRAIFTAMNQASLIIVPFTCPHFSKAIIEAGSCGKAVVASDNPYAREALVPGETGLLVPPGDARALADAITDLLGDPQKAKRMGEAAQDFIREHFSRKRSLEKLMDVYDRICAPCQ